MDFTKATSSKALKYLGSQYSKSRITETTDVKNPNLSTETSIVVNKERFGTEALPVAWRTAELPIQPTIFWPQLSKIPDVKKPRHFWRGRLVEAS